MMGVELAQSVHVCVFVCECFTHAVQTWQLFTTHPFFDFSCTCKHMMLFLMLQVGQHKILLKLEL